MNIGADAEQAAVAGFRGEDPPRTSPAYVFDLVDALADGSPLDFHGHPVPLDVQRHIDNVMGVRATDAAQAGRRL